jgi:hypothetical protein
MNVASVLSVLLFFSLSKAYAGGVPPQLSEELRQVAGSSATDCGWAGSTSTKEWELGLACVNSASTSKKAFVFVQRTEPGRDDEWHAWVGTQEGKFYVGHYPGQKDHKRAILTECVNLEVLRPEHGGANFDDIICRKVSSPSP